MLTIRIQIKGISNNKKDKNKHQTACEQDQDGSSVLILLASCQQTCMTYTTAVCTVKNS